jgi:hypothetical protein
MGTLQVFVFTVTFMVMTFAVNSAARIRNGEATLVSLY